jgi:tight adherence protein B
MAYALCVGVLVALAYWLLAAPSAPAKKNAGLLALSSHAGALSREGRASGRGLLQVLAVFRRWLVRVATQLAKTPLVAALLSCAPVAVCVEALRQDARFAPLTRQQVVAAGLMALPAAAALLWFLSGSWALALVVVAGGAPVAVVAYARQFERKRKAALALEVPQVLRTLATALGSGLTLPQAMRHVGDVRPGELGVAFRHAAMELACGASVDEALEDLERRVVVPGIDLLIITLEVSRTTGAPLEGLLMKSARLIEAEAVQKKTLMAKTAQVRTSAKVVMTLPAVLVVLMAVISSDYRAGLLSAGGFTCLCVAALLDGVALVWMRRLMRQVS